MLLLQILQSPRSESETLLLSFDCFLKVAGAFIYPPTPLQAVALFAKLTNLFQLIERDPLTALWNNEASFLCILSPRMASPARVHSVHIKVPYQCGIWSSRNYWSGWKPPHSHLHWGWHDIMEQKASLSGETMAARSGCFFVISGNSAAGSQSRKWVRKVVMGDISVPLMHLFRSRWLQVKMLQMNLIWSRNVYERFLLHLKTEVVDGSDPGENTADAVSWFRTENRVI